jgi:hypothetical protein
MYCNMPRPSFTAYQRVRMHVISLGSLEDVHSPTIAGAVGSNWGGIGARIAYQQHCGCPCQQSDHACNCLPCVKLRSDPLKLLNVG